MDDTAGVICVFCGSAMCLIRELPAAVEIHALRFFSCATCGASELRLAEARERVTPKTPDRQDA
jgi:hypothetical protein